LRFSAYNRSRQTGKHENDLIERGGKRERRFGKGSAATKLGHTLQAETLASGEEEETLRPATNTLQNKGETHDLPPQENESVAERLIFIL
jgi:hypothetical protein